MEANKSQVQKFEAAVHFINGYTDPLPADLLLKLYAYYKIARQNFDHPASRNGLINGFKSNALVQVKDMGPKEAMSHYIDLVENEVKNRSSA